MRIFGKVFPSFCKGESHKDYFNEDGIHKLIDSLHDEEQKHYLTERWLHQIHWLNKWAWEARGHFLCVRTSIVIGGVLVPFLVTADFGAYTEWVRRLASFLSLMVAAGVALEALYNWNGIWLEKLRAAELLKVEGWLFLYGVGLYEKPLSKDAFQKFITQVENQIAAEVGQYLAASQPPPPPGADDRAAPATGEGNVSSSRP